MLDKKEIISKLEKEKDYAIQVNPVMALAISRCIEIINGMEESNDR